MSVVDGGGLPAGTQLNGIYEIDRRIGKGGMGEVYAGREIHSGARVAIKMVLPELVHDEKIIELFTHEATTLNRLHHEGIVSYSVFSIDPALRRPYLAMEFADGPSLKDRMRRGRPLTEHEFASLQRRIAGALGAAHRAGIVHRDMSPDNIVLIDDNVDKAKIIDFGIAKSMGAERTLIGHDLAGKLSYMSPEQIGLFGGNVTEKSDVYALGLVFAEALTGKSMKMGGSQAEAVDKRKTVPELSTVPDAYRPLISAMLQPDPANRPSMQEVADWQPGGEEVNGGGGGGVLLKMIGGLVAGVLLIGAVLFFVLQPKTELSPGVAGEATAPPAMTNSAYRWSMPAFSYSGDPAELKLTPGPLPPGIEFAAGAGGSGTISGTPVNPGSAIVEITAEAPDGTTAVQKIRLTIETPPNRPPQVVEAVTSPIDLKFAQDVNLRVGVFADDGGPENLNIAASGGLPAGLQVLPGTGGMAQLFGKPNQSGSFTVTVTATDAGGESATFQLSLNVAEKTTIIIEPDRFKATRDYISGYNSVPCMFVRSRELGPRLAMIEAYAGQVDPIGTLDKAFLRDMGYEAKIAGRLVTAEQCSVLDRFSRAGAAMFENNLKFNIPNDNPTAGEPVKGIISNGAQAMLFLVDERGQIRDLGARTAAIAGDLEFITTLYGKGPQIIIAAVPKSSGGLPGVTNIDHLLDPSMRDQVKLGIGYVVVR